MAVFCLQAELSKTSFRCFRDCNDELSFKPLINEAIIDVSYNPIKKIQVGKDQEKAQSERDSHSKNRGGKKTKLTIRHLYHETYRKPNEQLFSQ